MHAGLNATLLLKGVSVHMCFKTYGREIVGVFGSQPAYSPPTMCGPASVASGDYFLGTGSGIDTSTHSQRHELAVKEGDSEAPYSETRSVAAPLQLISPPCGLVYRPSDSVCFLPMSSWSSPRHRSMQIFKAPPDQSSCLVP